MFRQTGMPEYWVNRYTVCIIVMQKVHHYFKNIFYTWWALCIKCKKYIYHLYVSSCNLSSLLFSLFNNTRKWVLFGGIEALMGQSHEIFLLHFFLNQFILIPLDMSKAISIVYTFSSSYCTFKISWDCPFNILAWNI